MVSSLPMSCTVEGNPRRAKAEAGNRCLSENSLMKKIKVNYLSYLTTLLQGQVALNPLNKMFHYNTMLGKAKKNTHRAWKILSG